MCERVLDCVHAQVHICTCMSVREYVLCECVRVYMIVQLHWFPPLLWLASMIHHPLIQSYLSTLCICADIRGAACFVRDDKRGRADGIAIDVDATDSVTIYSVHRRRRRV